MIAQIKMLCLSVTENNYNAVVQKGYELLVKLHDLGFEKQNVYHLSILFIPILYKSYKLHKE